MLYSLKAAGIIAKSRAKDHFSGIFKNAKKQEMAAPAPETFDLEAYTAAIDIDTQVYHKAYSILKQDRFYEKESPNLVAEFEYYGAVFSDAYVHTDVVSHVSVYDASKDLIDHYTSVRYIKANKRLTRNSVDYVNGTTLHMCALVAGMQGNFAHWTLDLLARLVLLEDRSRNPVPYDKLLIPAEIPSLRESLIAIGIDERKIVELKANQPLQFERLICVSHPRGYSSHFAPGWLLEGYRKRLKHAIDCGASNVRKKLYISRLDARTRKFRQESELVERLEKIGYESIELSRYGFSEKAELFASASDVIGLSGAGMMSVMFCAPKTRIIEIYPSNFVNYQFASICGALDQDHHAYIFPNNSMKSLLSRYSGQFDIDVDHFMNFIETR